MTAIDEIRRRIVGTTTGLFAHAPYPLEDSLQYRGDPGLFGPDSVTWRLTGDVATFVGGIRALLVQAAHQEVAAGVADHSRYQDDPLGRLSRTSSYVTATAFGAMPEVQGAVRMVRRAHRPVRGESHRLKSYAADDPGHAAWVHNVLTYSFLSAYQVFGKDKLSDRDADRFVAEQTAVGRLLDADPLPRTAEELIEWVVEHPDIGQSPGMETAVDFLRSPPLPLKVRLAYRVAEPQVLTRPTVCRNGWDGRVSLLRCRFAVVTDSKRPDMTLEELERRIRLSWGPDTCQFLHLWDPDRPEQGQCGTTAMVVMDIMGGELLEARVHLDGEQVEYHYWTRLPNGQEVDFTRTQFDAPGDRRAIGEPVVKERPPTLKPEFQSLYDTMLARVLAPDDEADTGS